VGLPKVSRKSKILPCREKGKGLKRLGDIWDWRPEAGRRKRSDVRTPPRAAVGGKKKGLNTVGSSQRLALFGQGGSAVEKEITPRSPLALYRRRRATGGGRIG